jgi:hypothetical protein
MSESLQRPAQGIHPSVSPMHNAGPRDTYMRRAARQADTRHPGTRHDQARSARF